jgi:hypothetical protein
MNEFKASTSEMDLLQKTFTTGLVVFYSLPPTSEAIILRTVMPNGDEPQDGEKYIVEFCHPENSQVLEVLEEDDRRFFNSLTIQSEMDELAEDYLRTVVRDWEIYVAQSGRCAPDEITANLAEDKDIERTIIRGIKK